MREILKLITEFFSMSLLALGVHNVIFIRALGISPGIRMLHDPKKNTFYFCGALTVFQILTSVLVYFMTPLIDLAGFSQYRRFVLPLITVVACLISYIIVILVLRYTLSPSTFQKVLKSVTSASINSAIVGVVILTATWGLSLWQRIAYALGSSIGYFLAMLLIEEGERKIRTDKVPSSFRGLPVTLIYISILALALYGLVGHMITL